MQLSIVLPTRNEAALIAETLASIATTLGPALCAETEILIADDGSDNLPAIVHELALPFAALRVKRNAPPLGKGRAIAEALSDTHGTVAGFLDADLSTPPRYILQVLPLLLERTVDGVIGSRRHAQSSVQRRQSPIKTLLGTALACFSSSLLFAGRRKYSDTQCGFKFFRGEVARELYRNLRIRDGMADIEVLLRADGMGLRIEEIPIDWCDERESKRPLRRTLLPDCRAVAVLLVHYRLLPAIRWSRNGAHFGSST